MTCNVERYAVGFGRDSDFLNAIATSIYVTAAT
jgi:hypothetical protein